MATVTVFTAERTAEIEATSIVEGTINDDGHLVLTRHDGTPIDMGAVSGMKMNPGSGYVKTDAFSYVGPTDPGAVPNGSVWYDTTDIAGPFANDSQKGLVELATNAETITGTDAQRAVTPASLTARLATDVGYKVQIVSGIAESATPAAWPYGVSLQSVSAGSNWTPNGGAGTIVTNSIDSTRTSQIFYENSGGTASTKAWVREYNSAVGGGGWTSWAQMLLMVQLNAGSFTQATTRGNYPMGMSRLYYTTATSSAWDFSGMAGEVVSYIEGTDFGRQEFTQHLGGASSNPVRWWRTATASGGWTPWQKPIVDPGAWISYTPTWTSQGSVQPSLGNASVQCRYQKIGRTVNVKFWINFGSTTNFGSSPTSSDNWQFSLPVPAANAADDGLGFLEMYQNATNCGLARVKLYSTTGFRLGVSPGSTAGIGGDVDSITPFIWASGNYLRGSFTYESAS